MLPDMSEVLTEWEIPVIIKTITRATVDFVPTNTITTRTVRAVVQVPTKERLVASGMDYSQVSWWIHSKEKINNGEYLEFNGKDYKIIDNDAWELYGYTDALGEATNEPLLVANA